MRALEPTGFAALDGLLAHSNATYDDATAPIPVIPNGAHREVCAKKDSAVNLRCTMSVRWVAAWVADIERKRA